MRGLLILFMLLVGPAQAQAQAPLLMEVRGEVLAPDGWLGFCYRVPSECNLFVPAPRDVVLTNKSWSDLLRINSWVNETIKPLTDMDHWGVVEKWSYPDDGYGDCEDYALLKRRMLIEAGWPRSALLMTVVRESNATQLHAVLIVKTDKGEFILDNQEREIHLWSSTTRRYQFVMRQSQEHPNKWVGLGDPRANPSLVASTRN